MAVKIALGNDMDLVFIGFQLFPRLEGMDPSSEAPRLGSIEILENMWRPFSRGCSLLEISYASG